jgi:nucleoside-diphosphate-sugar epimerase
MSRHLIVCGTGFVGQATLDEATRRGLDCRSIHAPRLRILDDGGEPWEAVESRIARDPEEYESLVSALAGAGAVINAAGHADATSRDWSLLWSANVLAAIYLASACADAGVPRFVHVSSAAVQGRRDPLDESPTVAPVSLYAESKAAAELALLGAPARVIHAPLVVAYRATSVHGEGRSLTAEFATFATRHRWLPVLGTEGRATPLALVDNVAAGLLACAVADDPPSIVLHPFEGMTTRTVLELFGGPVRRGRVLPAATARAVMAASRTVGTFLPKSLPTLRRVEVLLVGQGQESSWLDRQGFKLPYGIDEWEKLASMSG